MPKAKVTIHARLKVSREEKEILNDLMRRWSACMRFAYKKLLEGKTRNELKKQLQKIFNLNSRYVDDAILEAQNVITLAKELGFNPKKVVFGGKVLFEKLSKKHLAEKQRNRLKRKWREKRQGNLYSRGDRNKKGNLNLRIIIQNEKPYLRVNVGNKKWIALELITSHKKWEIFETYLIQEVPYSVRVQKRNGKYYCYITFEEEIPPVNIGFDNGAIGIDLNASPSHIAWAEVGKDGNLKSYGEIPTPHLFDGKKTKRDYFAWIYAHQIIKIALEKRKGIVLESLEIKNRGFRGDYSGRKSRRIRHNFSYRKLKERIIYLAKRFGIAVKKVNLAYTSVIGMLKYAPQFNLTKDVASALVIVRKGLGFSEKIPKNYKKLLEKIEESPQCEPRTVLESTNGRNSGTAGKVKTCLYNPWRVLRVAVLTALSPEPQKLPRSGSPLKRLLVLGDMGRTREGREVMLPGAGPMGIQIPPAGAMDTLNRRDINTPAPNCVLTQFG